MGTSRHDKGCLYVTRSRLLRFGLVLLFVIFAIFYRPDTAMSQDAFKPLVLSEDQMARYVAALPELVARLSQMRDKPIAEWQEAITPIARKHGFTDLVKFKRMSDTITVVMSGIDPMTKTFTEPAEVLEQRIKDLITIIAEMKKDLMSLPDKPSPEYVETQLIPLEHLLEDLKDGRGTLPEKTDPQNVKLIQKYFVKLVSNALPQRKEQ